MVTEVDYWKKVIRRQEELLKKYKGKGAAVEKYFKDGITHAKEEYEKAKRRGK